jgi:hypothetical protein
MQPDGPGPRRLLPRAEAASLQKRADRFAVDTQTDHPGAAVDLLDRLGGNDAAPASEEARAHRERIGGLGRAPEHGAFDATDNTTLGVCDEVPGGLAKIDGENGHAGNVFDETRGFPTVLVRNL